jgi:hypothetical protein
MPTFEDVQTALLNNVQAIRTEPDTPATAPFLAGYWHAVNDLTTLLSDTPLWQEDRLPAIVLSRVGDLRASLRECVMAPPEKAMSAGASGPRA